MPERSASAPKYTEMVYLLYGDDRTRILDFAAGLVERVSPDPGLRDMNITRLEGRQAGVDEIHSAAYALPFLAEHRLVIVEEALYKIKSPEAQKQFIAVLDGLPTSTYLALPIDDTFVSSGKNKGWQLMERGAGKFLLDWASKNPARAYTGLFQQPHISSMPDWIAKETLQQQGKITRQAASALAAVVGSDTGQARQEIAKLLTYVDHQRTVTIEDVQELAAPGGQADVFAMVDGMALGNAPLALRHLGRLLESTDQASLFGMIVRQFRLLILTREAMLEGVAGQEALARHLKAFNIHPFVAGKMLNQARNYSLTDLEGIYRQLYELDKMIKSGQIDMDVALQTFVAGLAT